MMSKSSKSSKVGGAETEKPVELGFVEQKEPWKLSSAFFVSKVGGKPSWLDLKNLPKPSELKCPNCAGPTKFLLQVYAPQDEDLTFHRTIFLFVCTGQRCCVERNSNKNWIAFRCQLTRNNEFYSPDPPKYEKSFIELNPGKFDVKLCQLCGCVGSQKCGKCGRISYCSKEHQTIDWSIHKNECNDPDFNIEKNPRVGKDEFNFPENEIVIETEVIPKNTEREKNDKARLEEYEKLVSEGKAGTLEGASSKDLLEAASYKSDKTFNKFRKRVDYSPEQILRYDKAGCPLWVSSENTIETSAVPSCPSCKGPRIFEFQVMPQLLLHLGMDPMDSLDWGTVVIYTCENNCSNNEKPYQIEYVWKQDYKNTEENKDD